MGYDWKQDYNLSEENEGSFYIGMLVVVTLLSFPLLLFAVIGLLGLFFWWANTFYKEPDNKEDDK